MKESFIQVREVENIILRFQCMKKLDLNEEIFEYEVWGHRYREIRLLLSL